TKTKVLKPSKKKAKKLEVENKKSPPKKINTEPAILFGKKDPLPRRNKPMVATSSRYLVEGANWIFEPHLKGLRALAEVEGKRVFLYSKSGLPFDQKFPQIV